MNTPSFHCYTSQVSNHDIASIAKVAIDQTTKCQLCNSISEPIYYILITRTFHNHYDHHDNPEGQEDHLECYVVHLVEVEVETEGPSLGGTEGREGDAETVPGHRVHQNSDNSKSKSVQLDNYRHIGRKQSC